MKKKEKIIKIGGIIFFILLNISLNLIVYRKMNNRFLITSILSVILTLVLLGFLQHQKIKKWEFVNKFIVCFFMIGLFYLFSFPVCSLPDEVNHFMRAYEISNGHLVSTKYKTGIGTTVGGTEITKQIEKVIVLDQHDYKTTIDNLKVKNDKKGKTKPYGFTNISMYSFVCYTPQAVGIMIGKILNLPVIFWTYLARLCNFIVFSLLLYYAMKHMPFKKLTLMFIAMLPITFQLAISISADSLTIATSFALMAAILDIRYRQKEVLSKKQIVWLGFLSMVMALCKIVYLPICLLLFAIPKERFQSRKQKYISIGIILFLVVIANLVWLTIASDFLLTIEGRANPDVQLELMIKNPFRYASVLLNTISLYLNAYITGMLGQSLALFNITLSCIYIFANIVILVILTLCDHKDVKFDNFTRILCLFIFLSITLLTFTSLYLDWTAVGSSTIEGVQGRYFIPIIMYLLLGLTNSSFSTKIKDENQHYYLLLFMIFENIYAISYIMCSY